MPARELASETETTPVEGGLEVEETGLNTANDVQARRAEEVRARRQDGSGEQGENDRGFIEPPSEEELVLYRDLLERRGEEDIERALREFRYVAVEERRELLRRNPPPTLADKVEHVLSRAYWAIAGAVLPGESEDEQGRKRGIIYLGLNPAAGTEAAALSEASLGGFGVKALLGSTDNSIGSFDLSTKEGKKAFLLSLGVSDGVRAELAALFETAGEHSKDELASLIEVFAGAERGERVMERMVLSGHSGGMGVTGKSEDGTQSTSIKLSELRVLGTLFPGARDQVRHLMVSACDTAHGFSHGSAGVTRYLLVFPNLKTIWAYRTKAPGTWTGTIDHLQSWEGHTAAGPEASVPKNPLPDSRYGDSIEIWDAGRDQAPRSDAMSFTKLIYEIEPQVSTFRDYLSGEKELDASAKNWVRRFYRLAHEIAAHPDVGAERQGYEDLHQQAIRLLHYDEVRVSFWQAHSEEITEAYRAFGLDVPALDKLGRKEAIDAMTPLTEKLNGASAEAVTRHAGTDELFFDPTKLAKELRAFDITRETSSLVIDYALEEVQRLMEATSAVDRESAFEMLHAFLDALEQEEGSAGPEGDSVLSTLRASPELKGQHRALDLLDGLRGLSPLVIPASWI